MAGFIPALMSICSTVRENAIIARDAPPGIIFIHDQKMILEPKCSKTRIIYSMLLPNLRDRALCRFRFDVIKDLLPPWPASFPPWSTVLYTQQMGIDTKNRTNRRPGPILSGPILSILSRSDKLKAFVEKEMTKWNYPEAEKLAVRGGK